MPIIKSAIKRMRQTVRKSQRNTITKKALKEVLKSFMTLVEDGKIAEATKLMPTLQKKVDLAVKKNLMHANRAARQKSRYAKMISSETKTAAPAKKATPAKKPAAKKAPAKKVAK